MKKKPQRVHIASLEILDDAPRTLPRPSKLRYSFCFSLLFPFFFPPVHPFARDVFYERLDFSGRFVHALATPKRLYHTAAKIFCQTFPSATEKPARNFAVYGELINAVYAETKKKKILCLRSFPVGLKICGLNGTLCEGKY